MTILKGLPHYERLSFGGGSDWLGATAAVLRDTTHAEDKNNVALRSRVFPHDELPLGFPLEVPDFRFSFVFT